MIGIGGGGSIGGARVDVTANTSDYKQKITQASRLGKNFANDLGTIGRKLLGGGLISGGAFALAARDFARLDDELRAVRGITGSSEQQFKALESTVRQLGATTSFTAQQVGQAAKELARGGQAIDEISQSLPAVLDLARGTQTSLDFAASSIVRTLGQFNKEAEESARVVDILAKSANSGTFVLEDLGESLKFLGSIGDTLGFSLEEMSAAFATLADKGLRGGIAGRQLKRALQELADPAKRAKLEVFGLTKELVDGAGNFSTFGQTLAAIKEGFDGLSSTERVQALDEVFGEGAPAVEGLLKGLDEYQDKLRGIRASSGFASQLADLIDEGLGGAWRIAVSAVKDFSIEIGKLISDDLIHLLKVVREAANAMRDWAIRNKGLVTEFAELAVKAIALGAALTGLAGVVSTVVALGAAFTALATPVGLLVGSLTALGVVAASLSFNELASSISDTSAPALDAVDALRARLTELSESGEKSKSQMEELAGIVETLEEKFGKLGLSINQATGELKGLDKANELLDAEQRVTNNEDKLKEIEEERKALLKRDKELRQDLADGPFGKGLLGTGIGYSPGAVVEEIDYGVARMKQLQLEARFYGQELKKSQENLASVDKNLGDSDIPERALNALQRGADLAEQIRLDLEKGNIVDQGLFDDFIALEEAKEKAAKEREKELNKRANDLAQLAAQGNTDTRQGTLGGRGLNRRFSGQTRDLAAEQLAKLETANGLLDAIKKELQEQDGIPLGAF